MTADKNRINPIVPERDDMIGRTSNSAASAGKNNSSKSDARSSSNGSGGSSGGFWRLLLVLVFVSLLAAAGFGWLQFDSLSKNHADLQQRFDALESRLSSTDESMSQSGAALQLKISKQGESLERHWAEIKKLWGVTNDINKGKIAKNKKDIAFLATKRTAVEKSIADLSARIDKENRSLTNLSGNYLAITADIDGINTTARNLSDKIASLQAALTKIDQQMKSNAEAIESMDAFRRQTNQKIYNLENKPQASNQSPAPIIATPASDTSNGTDQL
jgi:methyl-accepting chemotaxis protein